MTNEYGTSDTFYKAPDGKYYKTKQIFEYYQKENESRKQVIDFIVRDYLGYKEGQCFPTILTKKLKELEFYGFDVILQTVKKCRESIEYSLLHKDFSSEIGKVAYIMAIVKNNINDVYKEQLEVEREPEIDNSIDATINIEEIQTSHKEKDIRNWLEDDEWN